jgi:O-antigen/teichoic acid export membrane protein
MADEPDNGKIFTQTLLLRVLTGLGLFVLAMITLLILRAEPVFMAGSALFLGALLFDYVTSVCDAMLQANYLMGRATLALVVGRLVNTGLLFLVIRNFHAATPLLESLSLILACTMLGSLVTALVSLFFVRQKISFTWHFDRQFLFRIFYLGLPFGLINVIYNLYTRFIPDYFAHDSLNGAGFASFNISFRIAQVLSLASTFLMFSVLPGLKQYIDEKHWQKAQKLYREISLLILAAGILLVIVGSLAGPFAITILTHQKYLLSQFWFVLPLMLLVSAVSYGYDLVLITLFAFNDEKWFLKQEVLALLIALLVSAGSLWPGLAETEKVFLILLGSLLAETYVVVRGFCRVRRHFPKILEKI